MCPQHLSFYLQSPQTFLLTKETGSFKFEIVSAKLFQDKITLLPALQNRLESTLRSGRNALYPVYWISVSRFFVPFGLSVYNRDGVFGANNLAPNAVYVAIGRQGSMADLRNSPFEFPNNRVRNISLSNGDQQFPSIHFENDFNDSNPVFLRMFNSLYPEPWSNKGGRIDCNRYLLVIYYYNID